MNWLENVRNIEHTLSSLFITDAHNRRLEQDAAFRRWTELALITKKNKGTIYLIGNGASASMASHFAADLAKNAGMHTQVFSDLALITAIANDMGYANVFSEPLKRRMVPGDMLVAISSSGNSENIVHAIDTALSLNGKVITLSAMSATNRIRLKGELNFYVDAQTYGLAETCHAAILHYWMDLISTAAN